MIIVEVLCIVVALVALLIILTRLLVQVRMGKVKNVEGRSVEFQRKYTVFKNRTNEKHILYLLVLSGLLSLGLIHVTGLGLYQQGQVAHLIKETQQLTDQVARLNSQQSRLITKMPVRAYPESGLALKEEAWEKVFAAENGSRDQAKLESELAQKLAPYFGLAQVIISIDVPTQSLAVSLTGNSEDLASKDVITENVKAFVTEANQIAKLTNIQVEMTATAEKKNETFFKAAYQRKDSNEAFQEIATESGTEGTDSHGD